MSLSYPTVTKVLAAKPLEPLEPQRLLNDILCQLNAPEREFRIEMFIKELCKKRKIPHMQDESGNLWINAKTEEEIKKANILLVSHLDHPGIRVDSFHEDGGDLLAKGVWLGGGPMDIDGARVWVFGPGGKDVVPGKIISATYKADQPSRVTIQLMGEIENRSGNWGACFAIPTHIDQTEIRTRSADDLISVCADLQALSNVGFPEGAVILLSHSEEINLMGTQKLLKKKVISKDTRILVVDTTGGTFRQLGRGVVIRTGDEEIEYSVAQTKWLERVLGGLPHETRKTHGATEAASFVKEEYDVGSLAVPVLHQHNIGWNQKPAEEIVSRKDYDYLVLALEKAIQFSLSLQ
jgi:putative aminopeptidase FrvX